MIVCSCLVISDAEIELAQKGVVCPYACASAKGRILERARDTPALRLIESAPCRCRRELAASPEGASVAPAPA